jgi:hypothetical protein
MAAESDAHVAMLSAQKVNLVFRLRVALAALLMQLCVLAIVSAQTTSYPPDPTSTARLHLGPLALQPKINVRNVGVDTNVFNQPTNPERDVTASVVPGLDAWLRLGRGRLSSETMVEVIYFSKAESQRSLGVGQRLRLDLMLSRLSPYIGGEHVTTHERPTAEIDIRARRTSQGGYVGVSAALTPRLRLDAELHRRRLDFEDIDLGGVSLGRELDHSTALGTVAARVTLTPLTTFVIDADVQHDRFDNSPVRDTDSVAVMSGFELKPLALISGTAFVGYRKFTPISSDLPPFAGLVAAVDVRYTIRETTRFEGVFDRDVDYSFHDTEPYFVEVGGSLTVTQRLVGSWDAVARAGRSHYRYERLLSAPVVPGEGRLVDRTSVWGAGIGYRFGFAARVGFNADYARRQSVRAERRYDGLRFGGTFTYAY